MLLSKVSINATYYVMYFNLIWNGVDFYWQKMGEDLRAHFEEAVDLMRDHANKTPNCIHSGNNADVTLMELRRLSGLDSDAPLYAVIDRVIELLGE